MPVCAFKYCKNRPKKLKKQDGITYHRFPVDEFRKRYWTKIVRKERKEDAWTPTASTVICSLHFEENEIYYTKTGLRKIHKTAVPRVKVPVLDQPSNSAPENVVPMDVDLDPVTATTPTALGSPLGSRDDSEIESILQSPRKTMLRNRLRKMTILKQKYACQVKNLKSKCKRLKQRNVTLKSALAELKSKRYVSDKICDELNENIIGAELCKKLISLQKHRSKRTHKKFIPTYTASFRKFALTLHFYSPSGYNHIRKIFDCCLPHERTLGKWYSKVNAEPGFTSESFQALSNKTKDGQRVTCSLIFDEMSIRQQKVWVNNKYVGVVNTGVEQENESADLATQVLVLMVVSISGAAWKLPLAYFLINGITAEMKANIIKICLRKCHDVGVDIVSLTFDGCSTNIKAVCLLGCQLENIDNLKTTFLHPVTNKNIVIFFDACHMLKLVRNTFEAKKYIRTDKNAIIKWNFVKELNALQQNEQLNLANKLTIKHIDFRNQIMKVRLATQLLSKSVSKAIEFAEKDLNLLQFKGSQATVKFIHLFNDLFDILNSQNDRQIYLKKPICPENKLQIFEFLEEAKQYIKGLSFRYHKIVKSKKNPLVVKIIRQDKLLIESRNKIGFLGFLICIESLTSLYKDLVENEIVPSLQTYRFSQDHLELLFGNIRQHGGSNNNPNALQFKGIYRKILCNLELRSSFHANCIPLDNFQILTSSIDCINVTSNRLRSEVDGIQLMSNSYEEKDSGDSKCDGYCEQLDESYLPTDCVKQIVGYISGWVVHSLSKKLKCEDCINALSSVEKMWFHKLIVFKSFGGLKFPSLDVFKICLKVESALRSKNQANILCEKRIHQIKNLILEQFLGADIFNNLVEHSLMQPMIMHNHRLHLMRAIVASYTKVRLHYIGKLDSLRPTKRQKFNKLVLFEGL